VEITDAGRAIADRLLAGIRILERDALVQLSPRKRSQLLALLDKLLTRLAELSDAPPPGGPPQPPTRLDPLPG
jgi:hypothetical protein